MPHIEIELYDADKLPLLKLNDTIIANLVYPLKESVYNNMSQFNGIIKFVSNVPHHFQAIASLMENLSIS